MNMVQKEYMKEVMLDTREIEGLEQTKGFLTEAI